MVRDIALKLEILLLIGKILLLLGSFIFKFKAGPLRWPSIDLKLARII